VRPASPAQLHNHEVAVGGRDGVEAAGPIGHAAIFPGWTAARCVSTGSDTTS
jgi:hypothetical protein